MYVFDSNAFLAFLRGEEGAPEVRSLLTSGGNC